MRRSLFRRMLEGWTVGMIVLSNIPTVQLSAQELPLNAGALFLVFPVGAQAVGMGQTAIAASGRGDAAFWNPAGLATLSDDEFALHTATLVAGRSNVLGAYFASRGIVVIGGAVDSPCGQAGESETRVGLDIGYQRLVRVRAGYAFVQDGLSGPSAGLGIESGSLGVDLARAFLTGSDLQADSPTFFSFRVTF